MTNDIISANVSRETLEKLQLYASLLEQWQKKINLIGPSTVPVMWERHFIDSYQLLPLLHSKDDVMVDIGAGAGFPGMVLAMCGATNIHLVESDRKKCLFLQEVARKTATNVVIHNKRAENTELKEVDGLISRACSPLASLVELGQNFLHPKSYCLFHKGENYTKELDSFKRSWNAQTKIHNSIIDSKGVIIELNHLIKR